jgi:ComF family protein
MLQTLLNILAPEDCIACGTEGGLLCAPCSGSIVRPAYVCFLCNGVAAFSNICMSCSYSAHITSVYTFAAYEGTVKDLVFAYKFLYKRGAAKTCATLLAAAYPASGNETCITYVPTSAAHIRLRGFDHAKLLAKEYAWATGLAMQPLLTRTAQTVQLGASRRDRIDNMQQAFVATDPAKCRGAHVLLIDDVITTGPTVRAAAQTLHAAGAASICVVSVARTMS